MKEKELKPEERLVLPADFVADEEGGLVAVHRKVLDLASSVSGTGVVIKVNCVARALDYELIAELHDQGLAVCLDLKLIDIRNTMLNDAAYLALAWYQPEMLTLMCCSGVESMSAMQKALPKTEIWGVTVPTNFNDEMSMRSFGRKVADAVKNFAEMAVEAGIGGIVCSPHEIEMVRAIIGPGMTINTPSLRPIWAEVKDDDQARTMPILDAFCLGTDRGVIGRPVLRAKPNTDGRPQSPREAVEWVIRDIKEGLAARKKS